LQLWSWPPEMQGYLWRVSESSLLEGGKQLFLNSVRMSFSAKADGLFHWGQFTRIRPISKLFWPNTWGL
jgi:hypothetical protein